MKKKILALVLVLALVASVAVALVACDETPADTTVSFSPIAKEDIKFGLICLHGENSTYDKNFIDEMSPMYEEQMVEALTPLPMFSGTQAKMMEEDYPPGFLD